MPLPVRSGALGELNVRVERDMDVGIIGAGSWGTALASLLARQGHRVTLWARRPELAREIESQRENAPYLPGVPLPAPLTATSELSRLDGHDAYLVAVPSFAVGEVVRSAAQEVGTQAARAPWVSLVKGVRYSDGTLVTMAAIIAEELPEASVLALSGPSFAAEVARDAPTSVVLAGPNGDRAARLQRVLTTPRFRVYVRHDRLGVELGGAGKNAMALAAGLVEGLGHGDSAKGALIARGLAEMSRLSRVLGAERETVFGLAGLGDLVVSGMSGQSRNHTVGKRLGRGESLDSIRREMRMVAEGVHAVRAFRAFAHNHGIAVPIIEAVGQVLEEGAEPEAKLEELMARVPKAETL